MNRNIMVAATIAIGATALFYLIKRKRKLQGNVQQVRVRPSRHLTEAFSKAKHIAVPSHTE